MSDRNLTKVIKKAEKFSKGRCSVAKGLFHPDFKTALENGYKYRPKVCGIFVSRNNNNPYGFDTREEALEEARMYKEDCAKFLSKQTQQ